MQSTQTKTFSNNSFVYKLNNFDFYDKLFETIKKRINRMNLTSYFELKRAVNKVGIINTVVKYHEQNCRNLSHPIKLNCIYDKIFETIKENK